MKRKHIFYNTAILLLTALMILGCGEGIVEVDDSQYQPKIAIEGFLFPHQPVERIYITRNFRVDQNLRQTGILLPNADVTLTDLQSGEVYPLTFDQDEYFFRYTGSDLLIEYGHSYRLDVQATIEGSALQAGAVTTVPEAPLAITGVNYESLSYYQRDGDGNVLNFDVEFERVNGIDVYLATLIARDAAVETFIYDNSFEEYDEADVRDDLDDLRYEWDWIQNTPPGPGKSDIPIFWYHLWFYGDYEIVIYAPDRNYQDFLRTYDEVQEIDGNFHEPVFHIEGDGIGVFGSAVSDTVHVRVLP